MVSDLASIPTSNDHFWRSWEEMGSKGRTIGQVSMRRDTMGPGNHNGVLSLLLLGYGWIIICGVEFGNGGRLRSVERLSSAWTCLAGFICLIRVMEDDLTWSKGRRVRYTNIILPAKFKPFLIRFWLLNISTLQVHDNSGGLRWTRAMIAI